MGFISINYDDGDATTYESVEIHYGKKEKRIFNTKNFVKDWYDMCKFMVKELFDTELYFTHSSSVNHFIMDGAPYDSIYLKYDDAIKKHYLSKIYDFDEKGIEFFVNKGTEPTWDELKKMCDDV